MMSTQFFKDIKSYQKPLLLMLLICFGFISALAHIAYSFHLSFTPTQFNARESLNSLKQFPEGLVLLSSRSWNKNAFDKHEKDHIINWLNGNFKSKTSIKFFNQRMIISTVMDEEFNFSSLLQKTLYIPDYEVKAISLDFKKDFITFTLGK